MKTPEEEADFIYNDMPKTDDPMQWKNWKYRIALAFKNATEEAKTVITGEKTQPCPACGKPLITPKEYFPALTKMNEEISKYREVLIKDYEVQKELDEKNNNRSTRKY